MYQQVIVHTRFQSGNSVGQSPRRHNGLWFGSTVTGSRDIRTDCGRLSCTPVSLFHTGAPTGDRDTVLFGLCFAVLLFVRLLPLSTGLTGWPGPDVALGLTFAWVLRRPDQLPALVIVAAFLLEDVFLYRPLGLWPLIVLLGSEAARLREPRWRDQSFMVEWLRVAILIGAMMLGYRVIQVVFFLPVPALGQAILQYLASIAAYPVTVFAARWLVGLRRVSPGGWRDFRQHWFQRSDNIIRIS